MCECGVGDKRLLDISFKLAAIDNKVDHKEIILDMNTFKSICK